LIKKKQVRRNTHFCQNILTHKGNEFSLNFTIDPERNS
jgi:hypothetical protein